MSILNVAAVICKKINCNKLFPILFIPKKKKNLCIFTKLSLVPGTRPGNG